MEEGWQQPRKGRTKSSGPRKNNPTPAQSIPGTQGNTNSFKDLGTEGETLPTNNIDQGEEGRGTKNKEIEGTSHASGGEESGGIQGTEEEENPPQRNEADQGTEEGEFSSGNETEGTSEAWDTPKRPGRGRKSKKEEREKESYKNILKGAHSTLEQAFNGRQTRKQEKVSQGGRPPSKNNQ